MELVQNILNALLLGLVGGSIPGPILISACTESLQIGFIKSLRVILWALIAESFVALLVVLIIFALNPPAIIFYVIAIIGGIYLIYIAWQVSKINKIDNTGAKIFTAQRIFLLTILNGTFWIFWITICVPLAFNLKASLPFGHLLFILAFEVGWLISTITIVFIFSRFRNILTKGKTVKIIYIIMSLILFYFAVKMILDSLIYLLK